MFETAFNLKFNLHKAYIDIGVENSDVRLMETYGFGSMEELQNALNSFKESTKNAAKEVVANCAKQAETNKEVTITYIGDSITSERESHMHIIKAILAQNPNIKVCDTAISGYKSGDVLTAMPINIIPTKPNICVVMIGTNDVRRTNDGSGIMHTSQREYERNLAYILDQLKKAGSKVLICTLPPFSMAKIDVALADFKILYTEEDLCAYNKVIESLASKFKCTLIDMRDTYKAHKPEDITIEDGLHLNVFGQTLLATKVWDSLADEINSI